MFGRDEVHLLGDVVQTPAQRPQNGVCHTREYLGSQSPPIADVQQEIPGNRLFSDSDILRGIVVLYLEQPYF